MALRTKMMTGISTNVLVLGLVSLLTWQVCMDIQGQYIQNVESANLHIPTYPFVALVALGIACFALVLLADLLEFLSQAVKR